MSSRVKGVKVNTRAVAGSREVRGTDVVDSCVTTWKLTEE